MKKNILKLTGIYGAYKLEAIRVFTVNYFQKCREPTCIHNPKVYKVQSSKGDRKMFQQTREMIVIIKTNSFSIENEDWNQLIELKIQNV